MARVSTLFKQEGHLCLSFSDLVSGDGVQSNQFLIVHDGHSALIDPGGDLTYTPLSIEISRYVPAHALDYVLASHQDPDIITSLPRWLMHSQCKIACSRLWVRFLPHLASSFVTERMNATLSDRLIGIPDQGMKIPLGDSHILAVPGHFLHSVGNFQFYDPVSKILFSGDLGSSMVEDGASQGVEDFDAHVPSMYGFHRRYMASNRVCRLWAEMVRELDIEMIVPQHGKPFIGREMVNKLIGWIEQLECGVDLMGRDTFSIVS